jgi:hypothetical protein
MNGVRKDAIVVVIRTMRRSAMLGTMRSSVQRKQATDAG